MSRVESLAHLLGESASPLDRCLLLVSEILGPNESAVVEGLAALDELAAGVPDATLDGVVDHLFVRHGFRGDSIDYHSVDNSFLDRVLERRLGMPITLSAVVIAVGDRVGLPLHGVGLPGHFVVGVEGGETFVDAFEGGAILDADQLRNSFHARFGPDAEFSETMLAASSTSAIVSRVLNNLVRSFAERHADRLDDLIELRAQLPGPRSERALVIRLAESRARWDIAADIREELDPADPMVAQLRSRLN